MLGGKTCRAAVYRSVTARRANCPDENSLAAKGAGALIELLGLPRASPHQVPPPITLVEDSYVYALCCLVAEEGPASLALRRDSSGNLSTGPLVFPSKRY
jgi:hypothetical protein